MSTATAAKVIFDEPRFVYEIDGRRYGFFLHQVCNWEEHSEVSWIIWLANGTEVVLEDEDLTRFLEMTGL